MKQMIEALIFGILMIYFVPMEKRQRAGWEQVLIKQKRYFLIRNMVCTVWHRDVKRYHPNIGEWPGWGNAEGGEG